MPSFQYKPLNNPLPSLMQYARTLALRGTSHTGKRENPSYVRFRYAYTNKSHYCACTSAPFSRVWRSKSDTLSIDAISKAFLLPVEAVTSVTYPRTTPTTGPADDKACRTGIRIDFTENILRVTRKKTIYPQSSPS